MNYIRWLIQINALLLVAAGIAFGLYGPLMMAFYAVPELLNINSDTYWQIAAFVRMFGAALFGFGLLLWSLHSPFSGLSASAQRRIIAALILGNLMGAFISITEQSSIWWTPAGWITTIIFGLLTFAYIVALVRISPGKFAADSSMN